MSLYDATFRMVDALETEGVDYVLVGGLAVIYYGVGRSTMDADFVVQLGSKDLSEITRHLGPDYLVSPQRAFEVFTLKERREIKVVGTPFKIEVFALSDDPFDQRQFSRRTPVIIEGRKVLIQAPEDVVIQKLRWKRSRDIGDVEDVIGMQGAKLDWPYIEEWCDRHGTRDVLEQLRREIPLQ